MTGLNIVPLLDLHACLEQVQKGRVDATLADRMATHYAIRQNPQLTGLIILQPALTTYPLHIGVHKNHPNAKQIISAFNRGLQNIRRSGEYAQISARYEHA
ncbi:substrate-binding periplasmic protein [Pseudoalteromonas mariniglutinosa]|uniref:substrate-binding periplasmic protein n=1 Tax=Pseudoalteromonas mariniglutinosa TaxID=206042 RepID=UPI00384C6E1D